MDFLTIPLDLRPPGSYLEFDNSRALQGLLGLHQRVLYIGQRLNTGATPANTPVLVVSPKDAMTQFGIGSMLANMITAGKTANGWTESWAIALDDDPDGQAATGAFTFSGTCTAAGTVSLMIGGTRVRVGAGIGDTAAQVATRAAASINAAVTLPVTAAAVSGAVNLTHRHKGEVGNYLDLRHSYYRGEALPKGLTLAITAMHGGTANPEIDSALARLSGRRYHYQISPYTDAANLTAFEEALAAGWNPLVKYKPIGLTAAAGTTAQLSTLGSGRNSAFVTIMEAGKSPTAVEIWAAVYGSIEAYYLNLDCARPTQTLVLPGILPPNADDESDLSEKNILLWDGIATHYVDDGGLVRIGRDVTTYQTNALGVDDPSLLDINTLAQLAYVMDQVDGVITNRFPRHKLVDDNSPVMAGKAVARPADVRNELIALARNLEREGYIENLEQFKTDIRVERPVGDRNRINALLPFDLVNQFRVFAGQVQYIL